jgi:hypothetical protein
MTMTPDNPDNLMRDLQRLDPVKPGELDGAANTADAAELLQRILSDEQDPAADASHADDHLRRPDRNVRGGGWRFRPPKLALGAVAVAAVAILALIVGLSAGGGGGGGKDRLASALGGAAAAAASRQAAAEQPYTYLKTREVSVNTTDADQRSWKVYQPTTREEWVTRDGSGRMRIVAGPSRFVNSSDRAEWEGAGRPTFLTLGFGRRTEKRWLAAGMLRGGVEELPADPDALAARLRDEAELDHGEIPVPAATLQLIAEDLRNPVASPELRQALYEAAKRVPGISYLGEQTDPEGRSGIAIGVTSSDPGGSTLYSMIFDPHTSEVLATETTSPAPGYSGDSEAPTIVRARVFLESRGIASLPEDEAMSLSGFEPSTPSGEPTTSYLIYRVPGDVGAR